MRFEINNLYDLEILVGTGVNQRTIKEPACKYLGVVNSSDDTNTLNFERTRRISDQKLTLAIPRKFIKNGN